MISQAETVEQYLHELPADRREAISAVRTAILEHLPKGYEERMNYGSIGYVVPHRLYPAGYHCDPKLPLPFLNLASQKNYMALYLMCVYGDDASAEKFRQAWEATGRKLDMGKCCVRFRKLEDVPLDVLGAVIADAPVETFIKRFESSLENNARERAKSKAAAPAKSRK